MVDTHVHHVCVRDRVLSMLEASVRAAFVEALRPATAGALDLRTAIFVNGGASGLPVVARQIFSNNLLMSRRNRAYADANENGVNS